MLIEFSVANFRSIRERVTLSMMATDEEELDQNVIQPQGLLKSAVIYGANASGKSNVLKAMEFMISHIVDSHFFQKGISIPVSPFRFFSDAEKKPSGFEILFIHEGMKYAYGFKVDQQKVHEEYLYCYPNDEQSLIFERSNTVDYEFGMEEQEQLVLSKRTLDNALYLSVATQFNFEKIAVVFDWFQEAVECWVNEDYSYGLQRTQSMITEDPALKGLIMKFFSYADFGIEEIEVINEDKQSNVPIKVLRGENITIKNNWVKGFQPNPLSRGFGRINRSMSDDRIKIHRRLTPDVEPVSFSLDEESEGTQRLFYLIGPWLDVLQEGRVLIVDELENSLHPLIVEQLVKLFHNPISNPKGAQIIFTTHNTNLLDATVFRRDQIWFTEKDQSQGSTDLYSLAEFTPRESEDIEKGYLLGRYGAIPFFGKEFLF